MNQNEMGICNQSAKGTNKKIALLFLMWFKWKGNPKVLQAMGQIVDSLKNSMNLTKLKF